MQDGKGAPRRQIGAYPNEMVAKVAEAVGLVDLCLHRNSRASGLRGETLSCDSVPTQDKILTRTDAEMLARARSIPSGTAF